MIQSGKHRIVLAERIKWFEEERGIVVLSRILGVKILGYETVEDSCGNDPLRWGCDF